MIARRFAVGSHERDNADHSIFTIDHVGDDMVLLWLLYEEGGSDAGLSSFPKFKAENDQQLLLFRDAEVRTDADSPSFPKVKSEDVTFSSLTGLCVIVR
jgi:hypothetical protein